LINKSSYYKKVLLYKHNKNVLRNLELCFEKKWSYCISQSNSVTPQDS